MYKSRINFFEQIKCFYQWVFSNQDKGINATHISLYMFLLNQNNRCNWTEWFKLPMDMAMIGSCIKSKLTYYKCLNDLAQWKLIEYKKGQGVYSAAKVKIYRLDIEPVSVPVCEPVSTPIFEPESIPDNKPDDIPPNKTINIKPIHLKQDHLILDVIDDKNKSKIIDLKNRHVMEVRPEELSSSKEKLHLELAQELYRKIEQRSTEEGKPWSSLEKATYASWTTPIRLLLEKDHYSVEEIRKVFIQIREGKFWWQIVRTTKKLREKDGQGESYFRVIFNQIPTQSIENTQNQNSYECSKQKYISHIGKL